jgi:hypothetical protein
LGLGRTAVVVVVGAVNSTFGWETLPGECKRMAATAPAAISSRPATATSTQRSQRRGPGLGIPVMLAIRSEMLVVGGNASFRTATC